MAKLSSEHKKVTMTKTPRRSLLLLLALFLGSSPLGSLPLSPQASISLITEDPGREIYLAFGHTALRVKDPAIGLDLLYNFGTIDPRYLSDPSFVARFVAGDLQYSLGVSRFRDAVEVDLQYEFRNWYEQEFDLTPAEVQQVFDALEWNALEENRVYAYDFLKDNCATRVPLILARALGEGAIVWGPREKPTTARELVIEKLDQRPWWRFWSLFTLGTQTTAPATDAEVLFLPDELYRATADAWIVGPEGRRPLVKAERQVVEGAPRGAYDEPGTDPSPWLWCLVGLSLVLLPPWGVLRREGGLAVARWFDATYFFLLGIGGSILVGLTFFSIHAATQSNLNLLWINPVAFVAAWAALSRPRRWHRAVWWALGVPTAAFLAFSWFGPQAVVWDHVPLLVLTLIRVASRLLPLRTEPKLVGAVA